MPLWEELGDRTADDDEWESRLWLLCTGGYRSSRCHLVEDDLLRPIYVERIEGNPWTDLADYTAQVAKAAAEMNGPRVAERWLARLGLAGIGLGLTRPSQPAPTSG